MAAADTQMTDNAVVAANGSALRTDGGQMKCRCNNGDCKLCTEKGMIATNYLMTEDNICNCASASASASTCDCDSCLLGISDLMGNDSKQRIPDRPYDGVQQILAWSKLRSVMRATIFSMKSLAKQWTQLGGHKGGFCPGTQTDTILKLLCQTESECLQKLMNDVLQPFVPQFRGQVSMENQVFLEMQDLLCEFRAPSLMDCKIGLRTYLEKELAKARNDPEVRRDLYEKMIEVDSNAPTEEEHAQKAVTKVRYMQWRESISSTCSLGFRIEGIKTGDQVFDPNYFKTVKTFEEVKNNFRHFVGRRYDVVERYLARMRQLRESLLQSPFFTSHELIGSSLLFVHDDSGKAAIWMIDFGKTSPLPKDTKITHQDEWLEGNHEDGYLTGFDNVVRVLSDLLSECDINRPS